MEEKRTQVWVSKKGVEVDLGRVGGCGKYDKNSLYCFLKELILSDNKIKTKP